MTSNSVGEGSEGHAQNSSSTDGSANFSPSGLKVRGGACTLHCHRRQPSVGLTVGLGPPQSALGAVAARYRRAGGLERRQPTGTPVPRSPPALVCRCWWWMTTPCASRWCQPCCSGATTKVGGTGGGGPAGVVGPCGLRTLHSRLQGSSCLWWIVNGITRGGSVQETCSGECRRSPPPSLPQLRRALAGRKRCSCCASGKSSTTSSIWCFQTFTCRVRADGQCRVSQQERSREEGAQQAARRTGACASAGNPSRVVRHRPRAHAHALVCLPACLQTWTASSCWSTLAWSWSCLSLVSVISATGFLGSVWTAVSIARTSAGPVARLQQELCRRWRAACSGAARRHVWGACVSHCFLHCVPRERRYARAPHAARRRSASSSLAHPPLSPLARLQ